MVRLLGSSLLRVKGANVYLSGFRGFSYLLAALQIIALNPGPEILLQTYLLLGLVGAYTVVKILVPFHWYQRDVLTYSVLGADVLACSSLPFFTGGLASGFLLYSLNPILTAALLLHREIALSAAAFASLSITSSQLLSTRMGVLTAPIPILPAGYLGALIIYILVCFLAALLPFIINANAYRRIEEKATIDERNRLAREMHDNLAQALGYLKLKTTLLKDSLVPGQSEQAMAELSDMKLIIDDMYADLREALGILRFKPLGGAGLMASLADYVHEFSQRSGIRAEVFLADGVAKMSTLAELQALRLVQEALTNVRKHARASKVEVSFEADSNWAEISVRDNGRGFNPTDYLSPKENGKHIGLEVMRERVESLGGNMDISSSPEQGTRISFRIPAGREGG